MKTKTILTALSLAPGAAFALGALLTASRGRAFDNWPRRQGFDCFYGFIGGETDQFYQVLVRNQAGLGLAN
jgi:hypothetical protein